MYYSNQRYFTFSLSNCDLRIQWCPDARYPPTVLLSSALSGNLGVALYEVYPSNQEDPTQVTTYFQLMLLTFPLFFQFHRVLLLCMRTSLFGYHLHWLLQQYIFRGLYICYLWWPLSVHNGCLVHWFWVGRPSEPLPLFGTSFICYILVCSLVFDPHYALFCYTCISSLE